MNDHNEWWRSIFHPDGENNFDPKIAIVPHVEFWWIDEKWRLCDITIIVTK